MKKSYTSAHISFTRLIYFYFFGLGFHCEKHGDDDSSEFVEKGGAGRDWSGKDNLYFNTSRPTHLRKLH